MCYEIKLCMDFYICPGDGGWWILRGPRRDVSFTTVPADQPGALVPSCPEPQGSHVWLSALWSFPPHWHSTKQRQSANCPETGQPVPSAACQPWPSVAFRGEVHRLHEHCVIFSRTQSRLHMTTKKKMWYRKMENQGRAGQTV